MLKILVAMAALVLTQSSSAVGEEDWRAVYLEQQRSLVQCETPACFRQFIEHYGTKRNIEAFRNASDDRLAEIFAGEKRMALRELADEKSIEVAATVTGDRARIEIKSRYKMGMSDGDRMATRLMRLEGGTWKIGE